MEKQNNNDKKSKHNNPVYINYNIRGTHVRVIFNDQPAKIFQINDAIRLAESQGLDLVQISFDKNDHIAVCKIIDYGKFKYEQSKREKQAKKQARENLVDIKTVQFSITTDDNDRKRLISQAIKFLSEGDKVKLTIRFRNRRESANLDYAKNVMKGILTEFDGKSILDSAPTLSGRELACVLRPI